MTTITAYQTTLRQRVRHLVAQQSLSTVAHEMQIHRNTLSLWLADRGKHSLTVRTLQKIETWCEQREAAREHGGHKGKHAV